MRFKSYSKTLAGTVKEVLGTAFSVGCQVDGKSPKVVQEQIDSGEVDSELQQQSHALAVTRRAAWNRRC